MEAGPRESDGITEDAPHGRARDASAPVDGVGAADRAPLPEERLDPLAAAQVPQARSVAPHTAAGLDGEEAGAEAVEILDDFGREESYAELRPPRRLRLALFLPIVLLSLLGSLMFAFPLAFAFDETGSVVAMLGLLIGCSAAGWGMMAARRAGYTWPGLPPRGSGRRPDWRLLLLYALGLGLLAVLAVLRVAALR